MEEKTFIWTPELNKRLIQFRMDHDWLFKKKKQPWGEFYKILLENGFPDEMTINHVRKKWSYMYETFKIAKKEKNKDWKYYKMFDKLFAKTKVLDKYESWSNEWRLKLIEHMCESKDKKWDYRNTWILIENGLRCQDLPIDCCIQDIKGLWNHMKTTFNRKHRLKMKKGAELTEWPLYESMMSYLEKYEPEYMIKLESDTSMDYVYRVRKSSKNYLNKNSEKRDESDEFQWSKDITESFIQIRLQNDWLFRERKWAWNDLLAIMREEYGFPNTLTGRDICRKWASTYSDYQKAKATNNQSWVYYTLFELYLGEGSLSLNPMIGWKEEWIFNLISVRSDYENMFKYDMKDHTQGWREVEKRLRRIGLPLDHSLLDLREVWSHLLKTYKWKRKFADKGILNEQWPFYEAMAAYTETYNICVMKTVPAKLARDNHFDDDRPSDDDMEDDVKLVDLKQRLSLVKPKVEYVDANQCRTCSSEDGSLNIFNDKDDEGVDLAHKLKMIAGVEVDGADNLPVQICQNCAQELENAYKFRRRCQATDKKLREAAVAIKSEIPSVENNTPVINVAKDDEKVNFDAMDSHFGDALSDTESKADNKQVVKKERVLKTRKRGRKLKYDYWKICEVCGKYTKNLISHLDMHRTGKEYSCSVCDKKFKFRSGLLIHKAVHDPTPRKTCEVCGKTFHVLAQYRKHFVYHANERKFECETCGKRFNTLDILRVHNRIHTDERPFSCGECGKSFRTAGCVSRHRRIVHRRARPH